MQRHDAVKALDIYRRAGQQVHPLEVHFAVVLPKFAEGPFSQNSFFPLLRIVQAERLSEFYEICKNLDVGRGERYIKIEQVCNFW